MMSCWEEYFSSYKYIGREFIYLQNWRTKWENLEADEQKNRKDERRSNRQNHDEEERGWGTPCTKECNQKAATTAQSLDTILTSIVRKRRDQGGRISSSSRKKEEAAAVGRKKKQQHGAEVEQQLQERRRMDITNCVQRCSISLQSLRSLSIQESRRHEEQNCRAIPEGHDDEHEIDDGGDTDTGTAFDDDTVAVSDSIQNTTLSLLSQSLASWLDRDDSDSDSNSTNNYDTGKWGKLTEKTTTTTPITTTNWCLLSDDDSMHRPTSKYDPVGLAATNFKELYDS